jgi:hypothetical protein
MEPQPTTLPRRSIVFVYIKYETLTVITIKIPVSWNVTPFSLLSIHRRLGRTYVNVYQSERHHIPEDSNHCDIICFNILCYVGTGGKIRILN